MKNSISTVLLTGLILVLTNCSTDDDSCPDTIIVDIDNPESLEEAEACGLSPAEPLGELWIYKRQ